MIDERKEEQASLYVLGALSPEESRVFEAELARDPALRALIARLRDATVALAGNAPASPSPAGLKQKVLGRLDEYDTKVVPQLRRRPEPAVWLPWVVAACMTIVAVIFIKDDETQKQHGVELTQQIAELDKQMVQLRRDSVKLNYELAQLRETNRVANVRIAMLNSLLADTTKAVAVTVWNPQRQSGVLLVQNLAALAADKDYQLWVIDPKHPTPVSAGVFQVDAQGNVRFQFKPALPIQAANVFAVSEERKGGVATPTKVVLRGNVTDL